MYSVKQFTWEPLRRAFVAEASDLGLRPGEAPAESIQVVGSQRTVEFVLMEVAQRCGEVMFWKYRPSLNACHQVPGIESISLTVLN